MINSIFRKIVGTKNTREIKRMGKVVATINALEPAMQALDDEALKAKTQEFRSRLEAGETVDELLPEAFAAVREASWRTRGERHYDVQLIGGITLHQGRIAEMRTGEGKTLAAPLAAYLNALPGKGIHIVTVNDYLARRDADWMAPIYIALGLEVGVIQSGQDFESKRQAYAADVTYGTNNEYGFDYLRDNMAFSMRDRVQRPAYYAIVDEVDSILIDEARTPLIISGPAEESTDVYVRINQLVPKLKEHTIREQAVALAGGVDDEEPTGEEGDYVIDEKNRSVELTERGHERLEHDLVKAGLIQEGDSLYNAGNLSLLHHVTAGLRAHFMYKRDVDYIVQNGEVVIVDEHTGRTMPGRRWSEGIHQAVEAKEGVAIQNETQTVASTTFQNYFRLYAKLAGMTGTADTEAFEFRQIYGLDVVLVPTNEPMVRDDRNDLIFLTIDEKFDAIVDDVQSCLEDRRPVLVGTASIEASERLSDAMKRRNIPHNVLNAKFHEREAEIVAQAGSPGTVTVATNMAGRGTDIVLGGNLEAELAALDEPTDEQIKSIKDDWQKRHDAVVAAGGLHIIGTERHESRRIDNQLRGRSGRQGDPGSSRFYLSLEDNLLRIFASEKMRSLMQSLGMEGGEAIEHRMVSNAIEKAQRKVEERNFDFRKNLLEYDDVANQQRHVIYAQRNELMEVDDISETIHQIREQVVDDTISEYIPPQSLEEQWDVDGLEQALVNEFGSHAPANQWLQADEGLNEEKLRERISSQIVEEYEQKERGVGSDLMRVIEKQVMLQILDQRWKEHLAQMDYLRQGIHLRAYAQKQPKLEYKRESFELFQNLLYDINHDTVKFLSRARPETEQDREDEERRRRAEQQRRMQFSHASASALEQDAPGGPADQDQPKAEPFRRESRKIGRNEQCPCGSGKKYKRCHGQAA
ncbi:MAG: preprotein translocase subunit SecA [Gammaproteobacteria bacterium]|nr:preprotein translocase subunit SecA [Gammaproteobacteria bacterium]